MDIEAAVVRELNAPVSLERLTLDEPRADEVLVKLVGVGVCHSDIFFSKIGSVPKVLGHEGSGVVEAVGGEVHGFEVGDRVVMSFNSCGNCDSCAAGHPARCENFAAYNSAGVREDGSRSMRDGDGRPVAGNFFGQSSFATYSLAYERNLVKVPDEVGPELFQILGPLGCGVQTGAGAVLNVLQPAEGSTVVVSGAGGVGLSAVLGAVVSGASKIIVVDINADRLELAKQIGATGTINGREVDDVAAAIRDLTVDGAQFAVDTTGNLSVIGSVVRGTRANATVGLLGIGANSPTFIAENAQTFAGRTVRGIIEGDAVPQTFIPQMIALHLEGRFPFDQLVKTYPFEQIQRAIADSEDGTTVKPVLTFT